MKDVLKFLSIFVLISVFLGGCSSPAPQPEPQNVPERPYVIEGALLNSPSQLNWIDEAVDDLVDETGAEIGDIAYTEFELVVWPDGHYGCPSHFDEDAAIDPESKEGYKISLRWNGRIYFYHGGEAVEQFLCREL
ncbi:MAG: hypothetical protein AAF490_12140 [Chloroflexota bacterium]